MTPGWENVRLGLAATHHPRPRFDFARTPHFWYLLALSAVIWAVIGALAFR